MSSIPEYLTGNAFLALEEARDNASHVLATRRALIRYRMSLSDSVVHKASAFIANEINRFGNGIGLPEWWEETIASRTRIYFQAEKYLIPPLTLTRFMGLEGNPTRPSKPILALTRDFLIAKGFLHADDLSVLHAHLLPAYELKRVFKPSGNSVFEPFTSAPKGGWLFAQVGSKHTVDCEVHRISGGLYELKCSRVLAGRRIRTPKQYDALGWLFVAGRAQFGAVRSSELEKSGELVVVIDEIGATGCQISFSRSLPETGPVTPKKSRSFEHFESYEKLEIYEEIQYTNSSFQKRSLPGGKRFSTLSEQRNADLGGPLNDKTEMGEELLKQFIIERDNVFIDDDAVEAAVDRQWELIEAGADLNIPCEELSGMTAMHLIARDYMFAALDLAFERDDINYLAQTKDGRYPFDFMLPSRPSRRSDRDEHIPEYATQLFKRALEQGEPDGISREQLLRLPADAPPLPPPSGFDDGPG